MTGGPDKGDPAARVEMPDSQGVQVGDHNTQRNVFAKTYVETLRVIQTIR